MLLQAPVIVLTVAVVAVGMWPPLLQWLSEPAGRALLAVFGF